MSYNGSGTFNINTAGQPVVTGTVITSTAFNLLTADLASGLTTALTKDGQTTPTANIPMGTFKITGLGAGTALTDAAQFGQLQAGATQIAVVTGTDTLAGTLTPTPTAYATGNLFSFVAVNTNTGAATININSLGAKSITKLGSTALAAGDIVSGRIYLIEYDGTRFQLINPSASSVASFSAGTTGFTPSTATTGAVTLAGTLATTNGGTGLTSFTANGVVYASSSSALATGSALTFDGTTLGVSSGSSTPALKLYGSGNSQGQLQFGSTAGYVIQGGPDYTGLVYNVGAASYQHIFQINSSEQMRLTTTGLVIGGTSAAYKLDVRGAIAGGNGTITGVISYSTRVEIGSASNHNLGLLTNNTTVAILDTAGNFGLGLTPSAWSSGYKAFQVNTTASISATSSAMRLSNNGYVNSGGTDAYLTTAAATTYIQGSGQHAWYNAPSGTAGNAITFTQAMTLDTSGNLLVGTTTNYSTKFVSSATNNALAAINTTAASATAYIWNQAASGNNIFLEFETETALTTRGSITYNRAGGLTVYNTTSDYRAKDIYGPVLDSGALIDSTPVYMGKMKGATQERPMFLAHEAPAYAHTGEKDAVDKDGKPVYQQMDASALIPVMWAEIQSLRKRLAAAGI